ncbi:MAG: SAM-dependent methyltransferase [Flavobacteriales bacterium]|nr:SAM-dependent methyltransferase [Flavobacteriales bacterium]|tara:strand:- start:19380 stop:22115 length:2736 start_codon:yes stop_codon:yes gene_type:complete
MAVLSWNEIKDRALKFSKEWEGEKRERAEKDSFWNDFFNVFGISRRRVATFEEPVKKISGNQGFIDLFWKGVLLVEHKSQGKDLEKAFTQAHDYFPGIKDHDLPKYILVSDFEKFKLYDLDERIEQEFHIKDFHKNVKLFGFIAGYQKRTYKAEDPVNIKAAYLMGRLHDQLEESGYEGHPLEVFLVRLLFCLFADDTGIFEKDIFKFFIDEKTKEDGSDLGAMLAQFFQVLNTDKNKRQKNLDEDLNQFPYVNGKLFEEPLPIAAFDSKMRDILLEASALNWGKISPAIFGSMFQSVMNPKERRDLGAHYTSETNILKLIKPLFLDELHEEFKKAKGNTKKLQEFHHKLSTLKFLDPACGCGNFLVITYRELRLLELEILRELHKKQLATNIEGIIWLDVDQFYGIEYDEWPAKIAEVALWLMDHQMNMLISEEFGQYFVRLPLKKAAKIVNGNALRVNWEEVVPKNELSYIIGNPPFLGGKYQSKGQKEDMKFVAGKIKGFGVLDYVAAWYILTAQYIQETEIKAAFVSTNSIAQGEQVGILWNELFHNYSIKIHFAHRTFNWKNEAKGNAAVHVVIIGFANYDVKNKSIFEYEDINAVPHEIKAKNINPYLVESNDSVVISRTTSICKIPKISFGNQPNDGGGFLFTEDEYKELIKIEPKSKLYIRKFVGSREFINNINRYCLWLKDIQPSELRQLPKVIERIELVKQHRLSSTRPATVELASTPTLFGFISHTETDYIIIPSVSSERRKYIPIGFMPADVITSNLCLIVPNAEIYHFGVLTSKMHMAWVKYTCGRLKSDYRYSNKIVYNNYPWPIDPSIKNKKEVETKAQKVLDIRTEFPDSSLADLYDPLTMPPKLVKAHQELDKAVDLCYRPQAFINETARIEFLFDLYNQYTEPLLKGKGKKKK